MVKRGYIRQLAACALIGALWLALIQAPVALAQAKTHGTVNQPANLRVGPGVTYAIVGRAAAGESVVIVGATNAGDWYHLAGGAWIAAFLVDQPTPTATATARSRSLLPTPTPARWTRVLLPTPTPTVLPTPRTIAFTLPDAVAMRSANLRAGPGVSYALAGGVSAGATLSVTGSIADHTWYRLVGGEWIAAFLVTQVPELDLSTPSSATPAAAATATPAPASGNDFVLIQKHLWDPYENGGSLDGESVHCGQARRLVVNVVDANGVRLNGAAVQVQYGAREIYVTGAQGKGDGVAEFVLGSGQDVKVIRDSDGRDVSSDVATGLATYPSGIETRYLIESNYCQDEASCKRFVDGNGCEGHFSWTVTFQRR